MKALITFFLSCIIYWAPLAASAQPNLTHNEFYLVGDAVTMITCDPVSISAGGSGAGMSWDFSGVSAAGSSTFNVYNDSSAAFATCNLKIVQSNGDTMHVQENSTDSYINGFYDNSAHTLIYFTGYDVSRRPFTYLTQTLDTYHVAIPSTTLFGTGIITKTGDAWGTLRTPSGTYNNVLRIRKYQAEIDTLGSAIFNTFTTIYQWFDTAHTAPLFQLDSIVSVTGSYQRAMYLPSPVSVHNYNSAASAFSAAIRNNDLFLFGSFEAGKEYEVEVLNLIGGKVFATTFTSYGANGQQFDMRRQVPPGIYIISLHRKDDPTREIMKAVRG